MARHSACHDTAGEHGFLWHRKLEALDLQLAMADSEGKAKKVEKLQSTRTELVGRVEKVQGSKPVARKDKHHAEMVALRSIA